MFWFGNGVYEEVRLRSALFSDTFLLDTNCDDYFTSVNISKLRQNLATHYLYLVWDFISTTNRDSHLHRSMSLNFSFLVGESR